MAAVNLQPCQPLVPTTIMIPISRNDFITPVIPKRMGPSLASRTFPSNAMNWPQFNGILRGCEVTPLVDTVVTFPNPSEITKELLCNVDHSQLDEMDEVYCKFYTKTDRKCSVCRGRGHDKRNCSKKWILTW
jgi:hypothetical protein